MKKTETVSFSLNDSCNLVLKYKSSVVPKPLKRHIHLSGNP